MSDEYTVSLNELEKRLAVYIGRQRTAINRTVTSANHNLAHKDPAKADIEGSMGELAFCKLLNTYPHDVFELSTRSAATGEDYGDVTMNGKITGQVLQQEILVDNFKVEILYFKIQLQHLLEQQQEMVLKHQL